MTSSEENLEPEINSWAKVGNVEKIVKDNTKFSSSVKASIVASFIYSLIIASIIFTATAALPDTKFSKIIQILIEKNEDLQ